MVRRSAEKVDGLMIISREPEQVKRRRRREVSTKNAFGSV